MNEKLRVVYICESQGGLDFKTLHVECDCDTVGFFIIIFSVVSQGLIGALWICNDFESGLGFRREICREIKFCFTCGCITVNNHTENAFVSVNLLSCYTIQSRFILLMFLISDWWRFRFKVFRSAFAALWLDDWAYAACVVMLINQVKVGKILNIVIKIYTDSH